MTWQERRVRLLLLDRDYEPGETFAVLRLDNKVGPVNEVYARLAEVTPWKHSGRRIIRGDKPHRHGRTVVFEFTPPNLVRLRLQRARKGYDVTLEGLYDMAARAQAAMLKRDRAFARRIRKKK